MNLTLVSDFKHDEALRSSFNELTREVFGFDFEKWYQSGYWGDQYRCFSLADQGRIIANTSASTFDFVIDGEPRKAVQIGGVMTHPDYRGQGLAAKLMGIVMGEYEGKSDFMFLMANETVLDFYPKFGFSRSGQNVFSVTAESVTSEVKDTRKLDLSRPDDLALLDRLTKSRVPVSQQFGVSNDQSILMFYLTGPYAQSIYYLPEDDIAVVLRQKDEVLHLYDILSIKPFVQKNVLNGIVPAGVERIQLHFTPDGSVPGIEAAEWQSEDGLFIKPVDFQLPARFTFPALSIT